MKQPLTNKNSTRASAAGTVLEVGDELTRVPVITDLGGGKSIRIRSPEHRAKAESFWARLKVRRKQPGNCSRCGRPHTGEKKQCLRCLEYQGKYRGRIADKNMKLTAGQVVAMVKQMRREVTKLREIIKQMQRADRRHYQRAYTRRKTVEKYHDAYPEISKQELSTMNHRYDSNAD